MRRLARILPVLLVLTACSTGQEADAGPTLEERRTAYVDQAEEACAEANAELEALERPTALETVPDYAEAVVDLLTRTVQEVSTVEPPEEDAAEISEKVLDPLAADVTVAQDYATQVRAAADAGDSDALLGLVSALPQTTADLVFMRDYGLVECASAADTTD